MHSRKSQFFEIDAIIAIGILIIGLIYVSNLNYPKVESTQYIEFGTDSVKLLRNLKVKDLDSSLISYLESSNMAQYTDREFSIARQIGIYHFKGSQVLAQNLTVTVLEPLIPVEYGYGLWVRNISNSFLVYNRTFPQEDDDIAVARTMITGLNDIDQARDQNPFLLWPTMLEVRVWI